MKSKWKSIKDCYTKHLRSEKTHTGQKAKILDRYRTWPWANHMTIFKPYFQLTPTESNVSRQSNSEDLISAQELFGPPSEARYVELLDPQESDQSPDAGLLNQPSEQMLNSTAPQESTTSNNITILPIQQALETNISVPNGHTQLNNRASVRSTARTNRSRLTNSENCDSPTDRAINFLNKRSSDKYDDIDLICLGYAKTIKKNSPTRQTIVKFKLAELMAEQEMEHHRERSPIPLSDATNQNVATYYSHFSA